MHRRRMNHLGLAEIVGTLMLVLIVVAAATAFAFFVSSEEQINLNEQTQLHFKNLENVTIQSVENTPPGHTGTGSLVLIVASSDIYATNVTDIAVGGNPALAFCQNPARTGAVNCSNPSNFQVFSGAGGSAFVNLTPFTVTAVTINYTAFYLQPFVFSNSTIQVQMGTTRGNEFVTTLFPPVAEWGLDFITGFPVLDGTLSYQPHTTSSPPSSLDQWVWGVRNAAGTADPDNGPYFGQEAQLPQEFAAGATYEIWLHVTNTLGLEGSAFGTYTAPA